MMVMNSDRAIFSPLDYIRYLARRNNIAINMMKLPERLLVTYQRTAYESARNIIGGHSIDWWTDRETQPLCVGRFNNVKMSAGLFYLGSSAAVIMLEEAIACGVKWIFEIGPCGSLNSSLGPGDIIVVTDAIRDEGTSLHYLPKAITVAASPILRENLVNILRKKRINHAIGTIWTTDGLYRETVAKFHQFKNVGALGVSMETSALFAVAKYRNVNAASARIVSTILKEDELCQAWEHESVKKNTEVLVELVLNALSKTNDKRA
jgi:uridine phosphorylase